jgi:hypothetical protein
MVETGDSAVDDGHDDLERQRGHGGLTSEAGGTADRQNHVRAVIGSVSLLVAGLVLAVVLGEATLRVLVGLLPVETQQVIKDSPHNQGVRHPYVGHLHTPNKSFAISGRDFSAVHNVDEFGFRNRWPWPQRADIVVLGDSVTFGHGVADDQAWPAALASSLPQNGVINLGLEGAGPQQYARVYETFGARLQPKIVLIGFFARNDFWDADMFDRWLRSGVGGNFMVWRNFGRPARLDGLGATVAWRGYLLARESYLVNLLLGAWRGGKRSGGSEAEIIQLADGSRLHLFPRDLSRKTDGARPEAREFQLVLGALKQIQAIGAKTGARVLVVLQPSKEEVYLPLRGKSAGDPDGPLRRALTDSGLAYLELMPAFRERAQAGEQLFFEVDGHPNAKGYALIAEVVLSHLKANRHQYGLID